MSERASRDPRDGAHRLLAVVGTRPEAIKMAPVVHALREHDPEIETRVVFTGQHTELVDSVLDVLELAPDYDLGIMREGQTLYDVVHAALHGLRDVVREADPDLILVQGDTATVFVAALVGFFEGVGVGHVEAGLRSGNKRSPFPEEVLRRLTDVIADLYFAPTANARDLLLAEGTPAHDVYVTGNTVVDALRQVSALERPVENRALREVLSDPTRRLVLLTAHRRESFGAPLRAIFGAVRALAEEVGDIEIVYPVHPNPNVLEPARELLGDHPRIRLVEPLSYVDLVAALRSASLVLTDSGGIQEEAPTFGVPVLVLREFTERPEGLRARVAELVGTDPDRILERACEALGRREPSAPAENPYGDGSAAARIADIIVARLTGRARKTRDWTG